MRNLFAKWLSALLIAALLLTPVAMMEEAPAEETVPERSEAVEQPVDAEIQIDAVDEPVAEDDEAVLGVGTEEELDLVVEEDDAAYAGEADAADKGIAIDGENFPDDVFRAFVLKNYGTDGCLTADTTGQVDIMDLSELDEEVDPEGKGIGNLKGIEYFTKLWDFNCSGNKLGTLNMSVLPNLIVLRCSNCGLESLELGSAPLRELYCEHNALTSLNVSKQRELQILSVNDNKLTSLDISNHPRLMHLYSYANRIGTLDISKCSMLVMAVKEATVESRTWEGLAYDAYQIDGGDEAGTFSVYCDHGTEIVTGAKTETASATAETAASAAPAVETVAVPAAPTVTETPVIPAITKSSKTTLSAAPGTVAQLELGGAPGKKFKSSNKKVATVNGAGVVTIKKAGKTKITFKVGKKTRKVTLTIKDPTIPSYIALNLAGTVPAQVGVAQALSVTLPENTTSGIKWKSSNKKVATVSKTGVVTFKKAGKVTITATATRGKKKAKVKFVVSK